MGTTQEYVIRTVFDRIYCTFYVLLENRSAQETLCAVPNPFRASKPACNTVKPLENPSVQAPLNIIHLLIQRSAVYDGLLVDGESSHPARGLVTDILCVLIDVLYNEDLLARVMQFGDINDPASEILCGSVGDNYLLTFDVIASQTAVVAVFTPVVLVRSGELLVGSLITPHPVTGLLLRIKIVINFRHDHYLTRQLFLLNFSPS